jgi:flagellar biosynthesis protein FlhF
MQYLVEQGSSHREVLEKVRARYGDAAQVLSHRMIRSGGFLGFFSREGVEITFYLKDDALKESEKKRVDVEDDKRRLLDRMNQEKALQEVLTEVRSLKEFVADGASRGAVHENEHPTLARIDQVLQENDFSPVYRSELISRARSEFSLDELDDYEAVEEALVLWIGDRISLPPVPREVKPRIVVLVGPTGVGKTTTIAKLAAMHKLGIEQTPVQSVRMITIDNYRIGALQQIETYGSIMGLPVSSVETAQDLRQTIAMYRETDLILVDTIGKSPRDAVRLAEMQQLLDACGPAAEVYLAVAATTKTQDMYDVFRQFEPFRYRGVVVTKLDETGRVGNVLSALAEKGKAVAWITDGQRVPVDIESAHPLRFLMYLEGFRLNRPKLEERYGPVTLRPK